MLTRYFLIPPVEIEHGRVHRTISKTRALKCGFLCPGRVADRKLRRGLRARSNSCVIQMQRIEDGVLQEFLPAHSRHELHNIAEQSIVGVAVSPFRSRSEVERLVTKGRDG